ncbi:hypothetical protein HDU96_003871 [Phlyctochytrium bullatum]|nr:hypothetical protein HDU96_003871 [Phlyctochytrium bullatum]
MQPLPPELLANILEWSNRFHAHERSNPSATAASSRHPVLSLLTSGKRFFQPCAKLVWRVPFCIARNSDVLVNYLQQALALATELDKMEKEGNVPDEHRTPSSPLFRAKCYLSFILKWTPNIRHTWRLELESFLPFLTSVDVVAGKDYSVLSNDLLSSRPHPPSQLDLFLSGERDDLPLLEERFPKLRALRMLSFDLLTDFPVRLRPLMALTALKVLKVEFEGPSLEDPNTDALLRSIATHAPGLTELSLCDHQQDPYVDLNTDILSPLTHLEALHICNCKVTGLLPFPSLRVLELDICLFSESLEENFLSVLKGLPLLERLHFLPMSRRIASTAAFPHALSSLPRLESVYVNALAVISLLFISTGTPRLSSLQHLHLVPVSAKASDTEKLLAGLGRELRTLHLLGNVDDEAVRAVCQHVFGDKLPRLEWLVLPAMKDSRLERRLARRFKSIERDPPLSVVFWKDGLDLTGPLRVQHQKVFPPHSREHWRATSASPNYLLRGAIGATGSVTLRSTSLSRLTSTLRVVLPAQQSCIDAAGGVAGIIGVLLFGAFLTKRWNTNNNFPDIT